MADQARSELWDWNPICRPAGKRGKAQHWAQDNSQAGKRALRLSLSPSHNTKTVGPGSIAGNWNPCTSTFFLWEISGVFKLLFHYLAPAWMSALTYLYIQMHIRTWLTICSPLPCSSHADLPFPLFCDTFLAAFLFLHLSRALFFFSFLTNVLVK